ncbi:MAG: VanZ family protein [Pseudomonadota bacterium]
MENDKGRDAPWPGEKAYRAAALLLMIAIAWLSLSPPGDSLDPPGNDKIGHVMAYGALTFTTLMALGPQRWKTALALCLIYGGAMEVLQGVMPYGREASLADMVANTAGALAALVLVAGFRRWG